MLPGVRGYKIMPGIILLTVDGPQLGVAHEWGTGHAPGRHMQVRIIVAGKPALAYAKAGVAEYLMRLTRMGSYELVVIKAGSSVEVSARLLERSQGCYRVALDERGESLGTRRLAEKIQAVERRGEVKTLAFLIGAAEGHSAALRESCEWVLTLSALTLQHELALVVLLEQLYRVASLRAGAPYHRD